MHLKFTSIYVRSIQFLKKAEGAGCGKWKRGGK